MDNLLKDGNLNNRVHGVDSSIYSPLIGVRYTRIYTYPNTTIINYFAYIFCNESVV